MEERGLRMTKALTSIKVYCSRVYSPVLTAINQDFPSLRALFSVPPGPVRSRPRGVFSRFPKPGPPLSGLVRDSTNSFMPMC